MSFAVPLIGIVLSLALLITLAYRGHSVIIAAPISALVAVIFSGAPILGTYTQVFMPAMGGFVISYFPLFLLGAIFGMLMSATGFASDLAQWISRLMGPQRAILATVLATALLTYGGVSAWVVAFTIYPIAVALFREADIPKRLMPAAISLGIFTFGLAALPGTPQVHNAIPTPYLGTNTFAAPLLGIIGSTIMFCLGMAYLQYRARKLNARNEGYESGLAQGERFAGSGSSAETSEAESDLLVAQDEAKTGTSVHTRGMISLLPIVIVVGVNAAFTFAAPRFMDFSYLQDEEFGGVELQSVLGTWSVIVGLFAAILSIMLLKPRMIPECIDKLSKGAKNSVIPAMTTASEVGYGAVIASLAVFALLTESLYGFSDNPLIFGTIATAIIAGITGSSSGGLSIAYQTFGDQLLTLAEQSGVSVEAVHRITAMASVSFDSLPHNGAIITVLLVTGMAHRESYKDIFVVTVIFPLIGVLAVIGLAMLFPGFV